MTPSPVTVRPDASITDLKGLFERYDFNAFPVVDDQGALCSVVSKLDLLQAFRPAPRRLVLGLWAIFAERVEEIMNRGIITVEPDEPVITAVDLMVATRRRSLPVIERRSAGRVVVGMISRKICSSALPLLRRPHPNRHGSRSSPSSSTEVLQLVSGRARPEEAMGTTTEEQCMTRGLL
jgi:CBS domain-containing protein